MKIRTYNSAAIICPAALWIVLLIVKLSLAQDHSVIYWLMLVIWLVVIGYGIKMAKNDLVVIDKCSMSVGGRSYSIKGLKRYQVRFASVILGFDGREEIVRIGCILRGGMKAIGSELGAVIAAQQVDSAEASTIAVPPSDPAGSPR